MLKFTYIYFFTFTLINKNKYKYIMLSIFCNVYMIFQIKTIYNIFNNNLFILFFDKFK